MELLESSQLGMSRASKKRRKLREMSSSSSSRSDVINEEVNTHGISASKSDSVCAISSTIIRSVSGAANVVKPNFDHPKASLVEVLELEEVREISSSARSSLVLNIILRPHSLDDFYKKSWRVNILHINISDDVKNPWVDIFSVSDFKVLLSNHINILGKNVEIISTNNKSHPSHASENAEGVEIKFEEIWESFKNHSPISLKYPHKNHDRLWHVLSVLECEFESFVDCEAILSPSVSTGIDAYETVQQTFIVQIEGNSSWKVSKPGSSESFIDIALMAGDLLYVPKCWFMRLIGGQGAQSLHLQLLVHDRPSQVSLLDMIVPQALNELSSTDANAVKPLPRSFINFLGVAYSEIETDSRRDKIFNTFRGLFGKLMDTSLDMIDAAVDQMAKDFILGRLPPYMLLAEERKSSSGLDVTREIMPYTRLRMLRPGLARAVVEEGMVVLYHCMDNSRERHENAFSPLEFELDDGPAIETLLEAYPQGVVVQDLPHPSEEMDDKVSIAQALFKEGFLVVDSDGGADDDDEDNPF